METMRCRNTLVDLQVWLGYDQVFTIDPVGHAGGLAIFWKKGVKLKFLDVNRNLIDCIIQYGTFSFFASCIYGPAAVLRRMELWEKLSRIGVNRKESWCVFGDFNDILHNGERIGGSWRSDESFAPFNHMVKACQLLELQSHGNGYTWSGNRNNSTVHSRLDRCFGNRAWFNKFPNSNQCFLDKRGSDHRPVLIHLIEAQESYRGCFRFDTYMKAVDEACLWFLAQEVEQARNEETTREISSYLGTWIAPPSGFFKCNVGMRWLKKKREVGAVWVLTDSGGMTLLHSRRSFSDVWSKEEAYFLSMVWAVESMISHKCLRVYFSLEWRMLVNAINRPKAWPSFKFKVAETRYLLGELLEWRVVFENSESNREARLIANSVITGARFQSYVARGSSRWLLNYFLA
ncbi:hypothetical protein Bca4012_036649 [Brassica carinata]